MSILLILPAFLAAGWGAGLLGAGLNVAGGFLGQHLQRRENKRARRYNSPKSQMARYKAAGLNPNLVYTQGNPGNYGTPVDMQSATANIGSSYISGSQVGVQSETSVTQADLNRQKVEESKSKQQLMSAQEALTRSNPYMDKEYLAALTASVQANAESKRQEMESRGIDITLKSKYADAKMEAEMKLLNQKFIAVAADIKNKNMDWWIKVGQSDNLDADLRLKAEVLKSKEFRNVIDEVEAKFMSDGELTPKMYLDFFKSFLSNLAGRGKK